MLQSSGCSTGHQLNTNWNEMWDCWSLPCALYRGFFSASHPLPHCGTSGMGLADTWGAYSQNAVVGQGQKRHHGLRPEVSLLQLIRSNAEAGKTLTWTSSCWRLRIAETNCCSLPEIEEQWWQMNMYITRVEAYVFVLFKNLSTLLTVVLTGPHSNTVARWQQPNF